MIASYFNDLMNARLNNEQVLWLLYLIIPFLIFALFKLPHQKISHLLRSLAFALLIFALSDPVQVDSSSSSEQVAVFDVSASISNRAKNSMAKAALSFIKDENSKLLIFPFAKKTSNAPIIVNKDSTVKSLISSIEEKKQTLDTGESNISEALKTAFNNSKSSSILIFSDGFETEGDAKPLIAEAKRKGISLFPVIPNQKDFLNQRFSISKIQAPLTAEAGTRAKVGVSLKNDFSTEQQAKISLFVDNKKLLSRNVRVGARKEKLIQLKTSALEGGLKRIRAVVEPINNNYDFESLEKHRWITVKEKSKILLINGDTTDARVLKSLLSQKGFSVHSIIANGKERIPTSFTKYSSVILNNAAKRQLPKSFLANLERFVSKGGGLLTLGGNRSYGLGGYISTPLERISPLKFLPPQTEKKRLTAAVVLVLDKSGSMVHQNKITAAKKAALLSVQTLKDEDYVSVIGFDHAPFVIIDLQKVAKAKPVAENRLRNLTAVGKTNLLPALAQARQMLTTVNASRKHIIVLSDGKFPLSSDLYVEEINRLRKNSVSVSAVALGSEADVPFMKILAKYGKGAFYQTLDPSRLPQIFVKDIKVSTGEKTLQENKNFPVGIGPAGVVSTSISNYRILRGFVETLPKKGSSLELITKRKGKPFPILASWKYQKGKVISFTSDANGRWSAPWLKWRNFPKFWGDLVEKIKNKKNKKDSNLDFDLRYSVNRKAIDLDLAIFDPSLSSKTAPVIKVNITSPGKEVSKTYMTSVTKGRFQGSIPNARPGDYVLNIFYGNTKFPTLGLTLEGELFGEAPGKGVAISNLEKFSSQTNGLFNPLPEQITSNPRILENSKSLFIPLVILAFFLVLIEAFIRELWSKPKQQSR